MDLKKENSQLEREIKNFQNKKDRIIRQHEK